MKRAALAVVFALCSLTARAAYTYYYNEAFGTLSSNWTVNGDMVVSYPNVITNASYDIGGVLVSTVAVPDGSSNYDVTTTLNDFSRGIFTIYLRASSDTTSDGTSGTYYAVSINAMSSPATLQIQKRVGGVLSTLYSSSGGSWSGSGYQFRAIMRWDGQIAVYLGGALAAVVTDTSISSGQPGVGCSYCQGMGFTAVSLGPIDHIGPTINPQGIGTSAFSNRVDIHWSGADDPNGPGIVNYAISRNGVLVTDLSSTNFSDTTVAASTSYTYQVSAMDYDLNRASATFTVTTPASGSIDPRRTGVRPTGTYWGGMGEQIDLLSGNLNYSLPLLRAQGRGGWTAGFNLSYNSENWRQDPGGIWNVGADVGYGYGWTLQAGSITPYYKDYWDIDHYTFTDASGAQYRLSYQSGVGWKSQESIYLVYVPTTYAPYYYQGLYFPDGSSWTFGSVSAGSEPDSGTMYPTAITDSRGNQIVVRYEPGVGMTGLNSSARILDIADVRAVNDSGTMRTYKFAYDGTNHLTGITNLIGTAEGYGPVAYQTQTLYAPFSGSPSYGQTQTLQSVAINGLNLSYSFQQDSTGALTKVTLPYGGYLGWQYASYTYVGSRVQPEVQNRYLSKDGVTQTTYAIQRDPGDSSRTVHASAVMTDPGGSGRKNWYFNTNTSQFTLGLLSSRDDYQLPGSVIKAHNAYTWAQDVYGNNPSISSLQTTLDPGANQAVKTVSQTVDVNGNVTASNIFDYTDPNHALRRYTTSYLTGSNYAYILSLPISSTVGGTIGGVNYADTIVRTNYYDGATSTCAGYGGNGLYQGNVTFSSGLNGTACAGYDTNGMATQVQNIQGVNTTVSYSNNNAVPSQISTGSYSDSMTWSSFLGVASSTNTNSASTSTLYDSYARQTQTTGAHGAVTTYTYTTSPPTVTATINGRWTRTTLDGLGRTIKVESGDGTGTKSVMDTVYDSSACSPTGAVVKQSLPYAPGGTEVWTIYTYDGIGRTVSVLSPDGASTSTYSYLANTVTSTDPAGAWKTFTMDAAGNVTQVTEPNPGGGANLVTTYGYDVYNHLTKVQMTRGSTTQTRTWTYTYTTSGLTLAVSTPESGTVTYTYVNGLLVSKTDAKNQETMYTYDSQARLTTLSHYNSSNQLDSCQTVNFTWDNALSGSGFTISNPTGNITQASYQVGNCARTIQELYSYDATGLVLSKAVHVGTPFNGNQLTHLLTGTFTYDNEGRMTSIAYPNTGPTYNYAFDTMGRTNGMTDANNNTLVNGITYGPAGQLLTVSYLGYNETRQFNVLNQLTRLTNSGTGGIDIQYSYSASQNNGKITQTQDYLTGEQVTYTYDALLRLASAATTANPSVPQWGQSYTYDGFGNLTDQTLTQGDRTGRACNRKRREQSAYKRGPHLRHQRERYVVGQLRY